jgi:hypothetical protein
MKRLAILASALALSACTDPDGARKVLEAQGYKNISITGYRYFGCGEDDVFRTGFTAMGPAQHQITGIVCRGHFKGSTVRLD